MKKAGYFLLITAILLSFGKSGILKGRPLVHQDKAGFSVQKKARISSAESIFIQNRKNRFEDRQFAPDRVLVKFKPRISSRLINAFLSYCQVNIRKKIPVLDVYQLQIPEDLTVPEIISVMCRNPDVEYAEPDYKTYICTKPDDTFFNYQYALLNTGQPIGPPGSITGRHGADMKATEGWDITMGDKSVVVAVLDTGIDRTHPDLQKNILAGGWNFIEDTDDVTDDNGHGTFISGVIAADTDNSIGISGVTWNCKILPIKGIDSQGEGYISAMIYAIIWATGQKVDIINMSVGADGPSRALESALKYAFDNDIVMISSSGNHHEAVAYPAAYDEYCLAVSATNYKDEFLDISNRGPEIDVAAPGKRIIGCVPAWRLVDQAFPYEFWTGTSIAAAHVSGLAALIKSLKPWLTNAEIMNIIRYTADDVNSAEFSGKDDYIGYGRINIKKALAPTVLK